VVGLKIICSTASKINYIRYFAESPSPIDFFKLLRELTLLDNAELFVPISALFLGSWSVLGFAPWGCALNEYFESLLLRASLDLEGINARRSLSPFPNTFELVFSVFCPELCILSWDADFDDERDACNSFFASIRAISFRTKS
jgi:hypothetical protein